MFRALLIPVPDRDEGFAVTSVPKGYTARQCVANAEVTNYWMRLGDRIKSLPNALVESLITASASPSVEALLPKPYWDGVVGSNAKAAIPSAFKLQLKERIFAKDICERFDVSKIVLGSS